LTQVNTILYVVGDPINKTDPSGLCTVYDSGRNSTLPERIGCLRQKEMLRSRYGITLTVDETALDKITKQPVLSITKNWTVKRVQNVYEAVDRIARVVNIMNAKQAIGDTELRLVVIGSTQGEAAITQRCDLIELIVGDGADNGKTEHTVANLIHEFGHIVTLSPPAGRTANSEKFGPSGEMKNRPVVLWDEIDTNRTINNSDGWQSAKRESPDLEPNEVVPDMFMFYIMSASGDKTYAFEDTPSGSGRGQVRQIFMEGGEIPRPPNVGGILTRSDGTKIESAGLRNWIHNAKCNSGKVAIQSTDLSLVSYLNGGACDHMTFSSI
jgi:hypothetical protein